MHSFPALMLLLNAPAAAQVTDSTPGHFAFVVPALDTTATFVDLSFLNPEPAGAAGRATVRGGHFVDGRGNRLRLLGSNLTFAGAFPDKNLAPKIAGHLRKLGMNVIRFHHMDTGPAPRGLWKPGFSALDPAQLDRLDWLIYQLKQHGIYTNLNLHVSRTYPGIPQDTPRAFRYGKGLDNFYPPFLDLQKDYARRLLTHRNPYTQTTYAEEPAVIVVELNNENSLTDKNWGDLAALPEPFAAELSRQWHAWLKDKYGNTARLRERWNAGDEPLGEELLTNADFQKGVDGWAVEQGGGAKMTVRPSAAGPAAGQSALLIETQKPGAQSWNLQFHQRGLTLEAGRRYTLSYQARADADRRVSVAARLDQEPWSMCGLNTSVTLTPKWQTFTHVFRCVDPEPGHVRISFNFNNQLGKFWLATVSLRPGGGLGLGADESLEAGTLELVPTNASDAQRADFYRFLSETECRYVAELSRYVREDLGVKALLCDSQVSYGGLQGMVREGTYSDFGDIHAYWQHPRFPGKPWDGNNWNIPNTSMVSATDGGTFGSRAWYRPLGKPYTMSEYDHPAPNDHAAELFPLLASFAAFQDWDGLYQFNYSSRSDGYDQPKIQGYFELCCHPGKKVFLPLAALMFRQGAVAAGADPLTLTVPVDSLPEYLATHGRDPLTTERKQAALLRPVGFRLVPTGTEPTTPPLPAVPDKRVSSTGQITWDVSDPARATYLVNAPSVRVAVGFLGGKDTPLGDVTFAVQRAAGNWAALGLGALDGKPIAQSSKLLLAAVSRVENSNMGWNKDRTSVGRQWGTGPTIAEGLTATVTLPGVVKVHTLDGTGKPVAQVATTTTGGNTRFSLDPSHQTLWYALTR